MLIFPPFELYQFVYLRLSVNLPNVFSRNWKTETQKQLKGNRQKLRNLFMLNFWVWKISSFEVIFSLKILADIRTGCNWSNHDCPNCNWSKLFQQTATGWNKQQLVEVIYVNVVLNSYSTSYTFRPKVNNCHNHNWSKLFIKNHFDQLWYNQSSLFGLMMRLVEYVKIKNRSAKLFWTVTKIYSIDSLGSFLTSWLFPDTSSSLLKTE